MLGEWEEPSSNSSLAIFQLYYLKQISSSASRFLVCVCVLVIQLCPTFCEPQTVACQDPLSMGLPREGYQSGLPVLSPGIFLTQGLNPGFLQINFFALWFLR